MLRFDISYGKRPQQLQPSCGHQNRPIYQIDWLLNLTSRDATIFFTSKDATKNYRRNILITSLPDCPASFTLSLIFDRANYTSFSPVFLQLHNLMKKYKLKYKKGYTCFLKNEKQDEWFITALGVVVFSVRLWLPFKMPKREQSNVFLRNSWMVKSANSVWIQGTFK